MTLPETRTKRIAAIVGAALVLLLLLTQLFLPGIGAGAIEDRLTEAGGSADVSLSAVPAARLLWGDGDKLEIDASGLRLEVDVREEDDPVVFDDLDRFGEVDISMGASSAGPIAIDNFVLRRDGDDFYTLQIDAETSIGDLAQFGGESLDLPGSGVIDTVLDFAGVGNQDLPIDFDMKLDSEDGRIRVVEGGGEIAGIPTGPLATLITTSIVVRI